MTPTKGLTMSKVTDVQLALHQICADEANPRSMTASILRENGVCSDDVMLVCDVAYLAIEDMRTRNIRASLPDFDVETIDAPPPNAEVLISEHESVPETFSEPMATQVPQSQETASEVDWGDIVDEDEASGDVIDPSKEAMRQAARQTAANKAMALRIAHGEA